MLTFDPTITLGAILQTLVIVVGVVAVVMGMREKLTGIIADVTEMKLELKTLSTVITTLAVQSNRLDHIETDVRELRHGKGFITRGQDSINGEYDASGKRT